MLQKPSKNITFRDNALWQDQPPGTIICFRNCRLFQNGTFVDTDSDELWVRDGKVLEPQKVFYGEQRRPDLWVNCEALTLAPGLLDIQMNGAFGVDFTSLAQMDDHKAALEQLEDVALKILSFGVTAFCPTVITARPDAYNKFLRLLYEYKPGTAKSAHILGAHFEGPFISPNRSGCHPKSLVMASLLDNYLESVYGNDLSRLAYVTLAPELPGAIEAIEKLCQKGIKVSIGHSDALNAQAQKATESGATCVTHLFNAMRPFDRNDTGILGLMPMSEKRPMYYGLITDGIHVDKLAILLAFCANPRSAIVVTDCIAALGLGDGIHSLGEVSVRVNGHVAKVDGTDTLAGSVSSMPRCVSFFANVINKFMNSKDGFTEALKAATLNPASFLGISDQMGTLITGSNADFVLVDDQVNVVATFIGGVKCYQADEMTKI